MNEDDIEVAAAGSDSTIDGLKRRLQVALRQRERYRNQGRIAEQTRQAVSLFEGETLRYRQGLRALAAAQTEIVALKGAVDGLARDNARLREQIFEFGRAKVPVAAMGYSMAQALQKGLPSSPGAEECTLVGVVIATCDVGGDDSRFQIVEAFYPGRREEAQQIVANAIYTHCWGIPGPEDWPNARPAGLNDNDLTEMFQRLVIPYRRDKAAYAQARLTEWHRYQDRIRAAKSIYDAQPQRTFFRFCDDAFHRLLKRVEALREVRR